MIAKIAFFILYILDAVVYANVKLTGTDLYEGNSYYNIIFVINLLLLPFLLYQAISLARESVVLKVKGKNPRLYLLLLLIVLSVTLSNFFNDFILKQWFRDSVLFIVYALIGFILYAKATENPIVEYRSLKKMFFALLLIHVAGILILTFSAFDVGFVVEKIFVRQFSETENNYGRSKLYFFALAGNEEAYNTLIFFLVTIGAFSFWKKMLIAPVGLLYSIYLGTRTVFVLYIVFLFLWIWKEVPRRSGRFMIVGMVVSGIIIFSKSLYLFLQNTFNIFSDSSVKISALSNALTEDTLGFRIVVLWGSIVSKLSNPVKMIFGISAQGLRDISKSSEVVLTAVHNSFLFYYATLGILGFLLYSYGFKLMLNSWYSTDVSTKKRKYWRTQYGMIVTSMFIYSLMNNSYSVQGMLIYILIIAFGPALGGLEMVETEFEINKNKTLQTPD